MEISLAIAHTLEIIHVDITWFPIFKSSTVTMALYPLLHGLQDTVVLFTK